MPIPRGLRTVVVLLLAVLMAAVPSAANAGPAADLCSMDTKRGEVPDGFPISGCVDGNAIFIRNDIQYPIAIERGGDTRKPEPIRTNLELPALMARSHFAEKYRDTLILLPGDAIRIPIGSKAASVAVSAKGAGEYMLANLIVSFYPMQVTAGVAQTLAALLSKIVAALDEYAECTAGKNWIEQRGCYAVYAARVVPAVATAYAELLVTSVGGALKTLLDVAVLGRYTLESLHARQKMAAVLPGEETIKQSDAVCPVTAHNRGATTRNISWAACGYPFKWEPGDGHGYDADCLYVEVGAPTGGTIPVTVGWDETKNSYCRLASGAVPRFAVWDGTGLRVPADANLGRRPMIEGPAPGHTTFQFPKDGKYVVMMLAQSEINHFGGFLIIGATQT